MASLAGGIAGRKPVGNLAHGGRTNDAGANLTAISNQEVASSTSNRINRPATSSVIMSPD